MKQVKQPPALEVSLEAMDQARGGMMLGPITYLVVRIVQILSTGTAPYRPPDP